MPPIVTGTAAAVPCPAVGARSVAPSMAARKGSCASGVGDISDPLIDGRWPIDMAHRPSPFADRPSDDGTRQFEVQGFSLDHAPAVVGSPSVGSPEGNERGRPAGEYVAPGR